MNDMWVAARGLPSPHSQKNSRADAELSREHGTVLRLWARLQHQMDAVQKAAYEREAALECENLRLRAELVLLRTSVLWGLGAATVFRRTAQLAQRRSWVADAPEAQAVICQTGCVGHAHPWLEADGQCRRSGQACERMGEDSE